jgi:hypothetical protein
VHSDRSQTNIVFFSGTLALLAAVAFVGRELYMPTNPSTNVATAASAVNLSPNTELLAQLGAIPPVPGVLAKSEPVAQRWKKTDGTEGDAVFRSYFTSEIPEILVSQYAALLVAQGWQIEESRAERVGRYSASYTRGGLRIWVYAQPNRTSFRGAVQLNIALGSK